MKKKKHVISRVLPGSIGEELELEPGDILAEINHQLVEDVFDYRYLMNDEYIELLIEKANGELWELEVEKDYDEDLGIEFENGLMDDYRSCSNHCHTLIVWQSVNNWRNGHTIKTCLRITCFPVKTAPSVFPIHHWK